VHPPRAEKEDRDRDGDTRNLEIGDIHRGKRDGDGM
jgi:hypothetical protein